MTQQLSPWLETAYGWNYGESGWNSGMDSNLLKFSVMFDRNVDSIVSSLPAAVNGQVHYNTSDNRLYFAVNTTYFSTPVPKWYTIVLRSTGATWQFNGTILSQVDSIVNIDLRLDALELTTSTLGTAAFEDVGHFATQAELDVVEAQSQEYTDDLRADLSNPSTGGSFVSWSGSTVGEWIDQHEGRLDALDLANSYIRPYDLEFGAIGDGVADDTAALLACLSDGRPVYLGDDSKVYRTTSEISYIATRAVVIHSNSAKIVVDSLASIRSAVRIDLAGKGLYVSGRLFLDCQGKSYAGFKATNYGAAVPKVDLLVSGLEVSNCYRTGTTWAEGDGILLGGNLNKLRVVDCSSKNIRMAAGAGVFGSVGVSGITISRDNTNVLDASLITIEGCEVGPVYCDDVSYTADQDGIRVFTSYSSDGDNTRKVWAVVKGCRFVNCHGRSVKVQTEWASVSDLKIERNGDIYASGYTGNPDIDFQVSGGQINNIQCEYRSNYPSRVINFALTRNDTRLNQTCVQVHGISVLQTGGGEGIDRLMAVSTEFDAVAQVNLTGVSVVGTKVPAYLLTLQSQVIDGFFGVNMDGIMGRASVAFVHRVGSILTPCFITGKAIFNQGSSVPFALAASPGDFTTSLLGVNRLVT